MLAIQIIPEINVTRMWEANVFDLGGATRKQMCLLCRHTLLVTGYVHSEYTVCEV